MRLKAGSIIWVDLDPVKGHEQAGRRPAVIVSGNIFNRLKDTVFICPITNTDRQFPLHRQLPKELKTTGFIMCDQIRTISTSARNAEYIEDLPENILKDVLNIIVGILEDNE